MKGLLLDLRTHPTPIPPSPYPDVCRIDVLTPDFSICEIPTVGDFLRLVPAAAELFAVGVQAPALIVCSVTPPDLVSFVVSRPPLNPREVETPSSLRRIEPAETTLCSVITPTPSFHAAEVDPPARCEADITVPANVTSRMSL